MGALLDASKRNSPFLKVLPGEEVTVVFKSWKEIPSKFDPEKTTFQYKLEMDQRPKFWENGSPKVAAFFDSSIEGDIVSIIN